MNRDGFWRHAALLFLALRAADLINLAAGLYFVPKYVLPADLGAVLPVTSFATCLAIPAFAFGFVFMRESNLLVRRREFGRLRSLLAGVFTVLGILLALLLAVAAVTLPRYLRTMKVDDTAAGFLVVAAAFLGCAAPVYSDALNALKRFGALGAVEILSALARVGTMMLVMPLRALAGYFAGNAVQPVVRILTSVLLLRRELSVRAEPFWNRPVAVRLARLSAGVTAYQLAPMLAALVEQSVLRTALAATDSAGYFMLTRLSDLLGYLTLPLLFVLFPYATEASAENRPHTFLVLRCSALTLVAAALLAAVYALFGPSLLALLPTGSDYAAYAHHLPLLTGICALTACQTFCTNAEIASGRYGFLAWFIPLHAASAVTLLLLPRFITLTFGGFLAALALFAVLRFLAAALTIFRGTAPQPAPRDGQSILSK